MHKHALTVEALFRQWNYRLDGMLDLTQLTKVAICNRIDEFCINIDEFSIQCDDLNANGQGLNNIGCDRSTNLFTQFFQGMDSDHDGIVNLENFKQRFNYSKTTWDWCGFFYRFMPFYAVFLSLYAVFYRFMPVFYRFVLFFVQTMIDLQGVRTPCRRSPRCCSLATHRRSWRLDLSWTARPSSRCAR